MSRNSRRLRCENCVWRPSARSGQSSWRMNPASTMALYSLHHVGERVEVLLVARIVPVLEEPPDLARRRRGHEHLVRAARGGGVFEILDVALDRRPVLPFHGTGARRPLLERRRELSRHLRPLRELLRVGIGPGRAFTCEPGQPVLDVDRVVGAALLAVVHDGEPGLPLLFHDVKHRRARAVPQGGFGDQPALLPIAQEAEQILGPRKASGVRREDPVRAPLHQALTATCVARRSISSRPRTS